jgi:hypothetical protein
MRILLFSLIVLVILVPLVSTNSFATSKQYEQWQINFQNFKEANKMNHLAEKNLQTNIENEQRIHHMLDVKYSVPVNASQNLIKEKFILAHTSTQSDLQKRAWYDNLMKSQEQKMLKFLAEYRATHLYRSFAYQ